MTDYNRMRCPHGRVDGAYCEQCINDLVVRNPVLPAWHDKPTVPGLWVVGSRCLHINELDLPIYERSNCRWYGPVPEDKP